jgi:THO complex subunit 4
VNVHYERSGRSKGSADVIFAKKSDAETAVQKYNGVALDSKAMSITLLGSALSSQLQSKKFTVTTGGRRG